MSIRLNPKLTYDSRKNVTEDQDFDAAEVNFLMKNSVQEMGESNGFSSSTHRAKGRIISHVKSSPSRSSQSKRMSIPDGRGHTASCP